MNIFIVIDKNDPAGNNIKDKLLNENKIFSKTSLIFKENKVYQYKNTYLITNNSRSIEAEKIDDDIESIISIKPDLIIFPTTHTSKSGIPSLMVHTQGNWGIAELGGLNKKLGITAENFVKESLIFLKNNVEIYMGISHFDIAQEATHHGPVVSCPSMFIEIGSSKDEWEIPEAGRIISDTIIHLIENSDEILNSNTTTAIGIGGTHTCQSFMKITLHNDDIAISHVCPKYALNDLNRDMILQSMEKSMKPASLAILDWKGLGEHKERIINILDELNIEYKKSKELKK